MTLFCFLSVEHLELQLAFWAFLLSIHILGRMIWVHWRKFDLLDPRGGLRPVSPSRQCDYT